MGALCHGHAGGEGQGGEQRPVIMLLKTQKPDRLHGWLFTRLPANISILKCPISATGAEFVLDLSQMIHYWPICNLSNDFFSVF